MEERDELFIYLNSSFNKVEYPLNKADGFTNVIKPSLTLNSSYDVALDNIILDANIYTVTKNDERYTFRVNVNMSFHGYRSHSASTYTPTKNMKAENVFQLVEYLNNDLVSHLKNVDFIEKTQKHIFKTAPNSPFVKFKELTLGKRFKNKETRDVRMTCTVGEGFARVMGMSGLTFMKKPKIDLPPRFPKKINSIFVYCDIIESSYVGDQSVHLLDIIPMKHVMCKSRAMSLFKRVKKIWLLM